MFKLLTFFLSLALISCQTKTHSWQTTIPPAWQQLGPKVKLPSVTPANNWWLDWHDSTLNELINQALLNSPTVALAQSRIQQSKASSKQALTVIQPNVKLIGARAKVKDYIPNAYMATTAISTTDTLTIETSWPLDLSAGKRIKAAKASLIASEALAIAAKNDLIANILTNYIALRESQVKLKLLQQVITNLEQELTIMEATRKVGLNSSLESQALIAMVEQTKTESYALSSLADNYALRLTLLAGLAPNYALQLLKTSPSLPKVSHQLILNQPLTIVRERPEVRAYESLWLAELANKQASLLSWYPKLALATVFNQTKLAGAVINPWSITWSAILPFNPLTMQATEVAQNAKVNEVYQNFRSKLITALTEVEITWSQYANAYNSYQASHKAFNAINQQTNLFKLQYQEGIISKLDYLQQQKAYFEAHMQVANKHAAALIALVKLYHALGYM